MSRSPASSGPRSLLSRRDATQLHYLIERAATPAPKLIQFIAASPGDGTSTIARDFAEHSAAIAEQPERVLLLDLGGSYRDQAAHFRKRNTLHEPMAGEPLALPHVFGGGRVSFHAVGENGFLVSTRMDADRQAAKPEATTETTARAFWATLRERFDYVVIDSPAMSHSFDGMVIAEAADASILVISAEKTRAPVAERLRDQILEAGGLIVGTILNRRRFYIPKILYRLL